MARDDSDFGLGIAPSRRTLLQAEGNQDEVNSVWAEYRWSLIGPFAVLAALLAVDAALGPGVMISASYAISAVVASASAPLGNRLPSRIAVASSAFSGSWNDNFGTLQGGFGSVCRSVSEQWRLLRHTSAYDVNRRCGAHDARRREAQRALLRSPPGSVGSRPAMSRPQRRRSSSATSMRSPIRCTGFG
jgi:hypothetical protein